MGNCSLYSEQKIDLTVAVKLRKEQQSVEIKLKKDEVSIRLPYIYGYLVIFERKDDILNTAGAYYVDNDVYPPIVRKKPLKSPCKTVNVISKESYDMYGIKIDKDTLWIICNCNGNWTINIDDGILPFIFEEGYAGNKIFNVPLLID